MIDINRGNIIGVVDYYGSISSVYTGEEYSNHDFHFPHIRHKRWRWNKYNGVYWLNSSYKPDEEELTYIENHLKKKYGIDKNLIRINN